MGSGSPMNCCGTRSMPSSTRLGGFNCMLRSAPICRSTGTVNLPTSPATSSRHERSSARPLRSNIFGPRRSARLSPPLTRRRSPTTRRPWSHSTPPDPLANVIAASSRSSSRTHSSGRTTSHRRGRAISRPPASLSGSVIQICWRARRAALAGGAATESSTRPRSISSREPPRRCPPEAPALRALVLARLALRLDPLDAQDRRDALLGRH